MSTSLRAFREDQGKFIQYFASVDPVLWFEEVKTSIMKAIVARGYDGINDSLEFLREQKEGIEFEVAGLQDDNVVSMYIDPSTNCVYYLEAADSNLAKRSWRAVLTDFLSDRAAYTQRIKALPSRRVAEEVANSDRLADENARVEVNSKSEHPTQKASGQPAFVLQLLVSDVDSLKLIKVAIGNASLIATKIEDLELYCQEQMALKIDDAFQLPDDRSISIRALAEALEELVRCEFYEMTSIEVASILLKRTGTLKVLTDKQNVAAEYLVVIKQALGFAAKDLKDVQISSANGRHTWSWVENGSDRFEQARRGSKINPKKKSDERSKNSSQKGRFGVDSEEILRQRIRDAIQTS